MTQPPTQRLPIQHHCYYSRSREGEQFVPEHSFGMILSGSFTLNDGAHTTEFAEGDLYFCTRNQLVKFVKTPAPNGDFRSLSILLDQETLRAFSIEQQYAPQKATAPTAYLALSGSSPLKAFMESLKAYEQLFANPASEALLKVKQREALLLLLQVAPQLKQVLFDFSEPGKIDLEGFMNRNYHFNVELKRFAYLTGRSLSTFKRDFEKTFNTTPSRWLLQKRLQEAYYLIKEKRRAVSDIYLDLGFEDLSHFSYAFKKQYGVAPSLV
ncbi:AraC-like DNA-binding protein [Filimonas zeae]|uniref:HTH araC/xylS-type domain-containing protein n=1 Tax=Filimonas zeae TaxID=1737353 RepID=A0A917J273_9BACT|nr:AraC family transcriptional regulator [Filimonas zeae]MDR6340144.1 AraC-like DNA-binding protein [Filimonas zeae]GGH71351.1 hypothetical protein GCM10011379_30600 [Filimonas zeae]